MGIPSYFSYIIKNHSNIIRNLRSHKAAKTVFHGLYMDCNSIIYDAVHSLEKQPSKYNSGQFEKAVIDTVIMRIREYIYTISPCNVLYIAFDGVAPLAKMDQQRSRRYKTAFMNSVSFNDSTYTSAKPSTFTPPTLVNKDPTKWNTSAITPGTTFMETLSRRIHSEFNGSPNKSSPNHMNNKHEHLCESVRPTGVMLPGGFCIPNVVVSTSTEAGEGEHKMFEYIRTNVKPHENIAVYGLDSDLIMLSILHSMRCRNIFIFRESPQFSKHILPVHLRNEQPELLFLDIRTLARSIINEMDPASLSYANGSEYYCQRVYDYILISVLLGNDFLPHMISLNLRGNGMYELLQMYSEHIAKRKLFLISPDRKIIWKNVKYFIGKLSQNEHTNIVAEYCQREKLAKRKYAENTPADRETILQNTPLIYRGDEEYICPTEEYWESRYYRVCFPENLASNPIKDICTNYIEGLEWVFRYYSEGCPHWRWRYRFHYPPLLTDLYKHIPETSIDSRIDQIPYKNKPFHPFVQLSYVLPPVSQHLLPAKMRKNLLKYPHLFINIHDTKFSWLFCKYFWEAHVVLPEINMEVLQEWETNISVVS
jgi:5'-3' exonuclease